MNWGHVGRFALATMLFAAFAAAIFIASGWGARAIGQSQWFGPNDSGWAQAIGAVLSIMTGFAGILFQVNRTEAQAREARVEGGKAAHLIAYDALETVSERLNAALTPDRDKATHRLRGLRTTEIVTAMREFELSRIPASMLADFIRLRSRVYAINGRITEVYGEEELLAVGPTREDKKAERPTNLHSAVKVWQEALEFFSSLQSEAAKLGGQKKTLEPQSSITSHSAYVDAP